MVRHDAVTNFLATMAERPGVNAQDRVLGLTSLSFDIAVLELWLPLTLGARVVLADRAAAHDPARLKAMVAAQGVTMIQATPSTWRMLLDHDERRSLLRRAAACCAAARRWRRTWRGGWWRRPARCGTCTARPRPRCGRPVIASMRRTTARCWAARSATPRCTSWTTISTLRRSVLPANSISAAPDWRGAIGGAAR